MVGPSTAAWDAFARSLDGTLLRPDHPDYAATAPAWNARFHATRPLGIVRCANAEDVAETLAFARRTATPTAIRSGGHSFGDHSSTSGLLLDLRDLNAVHVEAGAVIAQAGARLGQVYADLDPHGLTLPAGTCPTVGIAGLTLGGGLGILGRQHGLTCDRLLAADVVLADGSRIRCDTNHNADLFWALRGGGTGNFGVVTALTFDPVPLPATAVTLRMSWPWPHAAAVINAWQRWAPSAPDELAASLKITAPTQHGPPRVRVYATLSHETGAAQTLAEHLIALVRQEPTELTVIPHDFAAARQFWANLDADDHTPNAQQTPESIYAKSEFFDRELPAPVIDHLLGALTEDRIAGQSRELDFSPWAGAYARRRPDETAFVHRTDAFLLKHSVTVAPGAPADIQAAARKRVQRLWNVTHVAGTNRSFQNFADPGLTDPLAAYYHDNRKALITIKRRYDPDNVFRHSQSIPTS